jgi:hypothetical protein
MSGNAAQVRTEDHEFKEQAVLQRELLRLNAQLRDFERLMRSGVVTATYGDLEARRDQILNKLRDRMPKPAVRIVESSMGPPPLKSLLSAPVAAARLTTGLSPLLGYAGVVQAGPAEEFYDNTPSNDGFDDYTGSILTIRLDYAGGVYFGGDLDAGKGNQPTDTYVWNHSWRYLIPFPPAPVRSLFTCTFDVNAQCALGLVSGDPFLLVGAFTGETADFQGYGISPQTFRGAAIQGFVEPGTNVTLQGCITVRRSFVVEEGKFPAIGLALQVACELCVQNSLHFIDMGNSHVIPGSAGRTEGTIEFRYDPITQARS